MFFIRNLKSILLQKKIVLPRQSLLSVLQRKVAWGFESDFCSLPSALGCPTSVGSSRPADFLPTCSATRSATHSASRTTMKTTTTMLKELDCFVQMRFCWKSKLMLREEVLTTRKRMLRLSELKFWLVCCLRPNWRLTVEVGSASCDRPDASSGSKELCRIKNRQPEMNKKVFFFTEDNC